MLRRRSRTSSRYNRGYHNVGASVQGRLGFKFAKQICDYACLYTSRASNLGLVAPLRPFRPVRDLLPHEAWIEQVTTLQHDKKCLTSEVKEIVSFTAVREQLTLKYMCLV